jgi:hypothetical protein
LLKNRVAAEMEGVRNDYTIIFSRYGRNKAMAATMTGAPGGREADAERLAAVIKAITGTKPRIRRIKDGKIVIVCYGGIWRASSASPSSQKPS